MAPPKNEPETNMARTGDGGDHFIEWELHQLDKLDELANRYGWNDEHREYKKRLKLIQTQAVARGRAQNRGMGPGGQREAGWGSVERAVKPKRKPVGKWETCHPVIGKRFQSHQTARAMLGAPMWDGAEWKEDREAPGNAKARRYICINPDDPTNYERRRIVENKGALGLGIGGGAPACLY